MKNHIWSNRSRFLALCFVLIGVSLAAPLGRARQVNASVTLISFTAEAQGDNSILIEWETGTEANTAGFNLHRALSAAELGTTEPAKPALVFIPNKGDAIFGDSYSHPDTAVEKGRALLLPALRSNPVRWRRRCVVDRLGRHRRADAYADRHRDRHRHRDRDCDRDCDDSSRLRPPARPLPPACRGPVPATSRLQRASSPTHRSRPQPPMQVSHPSQARRRSHRPPRRRSGPVW